MSGLAKVANAVRVASSAFQYRKPKMTPEELAVQAEIRRAHQASQSYFASFPIEKLAIITDGDRDKVVMKNDHGVPDLKSTAMIELPPFVVRVAHVIDEGNCGQGEYAPKRGDSKFSFGLACGTCDRTPLPKSIQEQQEKAKQVLIEASKRLLGEWFDTSAATYCEGGYNNAYKEARSEISGGNKAKYPKADDVLLAEKTDKELKERVRVLARQNFIDGGKIPFGSTKDDKVQQ